MDQKKKVNIIFFSSIIILPVAAFLLMNWINNNYTSLPYYGTTEQLKLKQGSKDANAFVVPDFKFINQDNEEITSDFTNGKIWVADYFFTTCTNVCPKMTSHLEQVQEAFKDDDEVKIISFTVDPERDTAEVLRSYAALHHAIPRNWQFVTGDKKDLYAFARKGLFIVATDGDGGANDFIHSENLVLIDGGKHIRGYYDGTSDVEVNQLIKDIHRLKKEK